MLRLLSLFLLILISCGKEEDVMDTDIIPELDQSVPEEPNPSEIAYPFEIDTVSNHI